MDQQLPSNDGDRSRAKRQRASGLSYKFQRLREKIREAVRHGELTGKLPGERALARRFHANAKTLSKALTDLAAEGLLDRSIGRGTYVKGSAPTVPLGSGRAWLLLCDAEQMTTAAVAELKRLNPDAQAVCDLQHLRPSFLARFDAAVDFAASTPDGLLRDLTVRGIPVISASARAKSYSGHAVLMDRSLAAFSAARDLLLLGHTVLSAVVVGSAPEVREAMRQAAARYAPGAVVEQCLPAEVPTLLDRGTTAIICDSLRAAEQVRRILDGRGLTVPDQVSLAVMDITPQEVAYSGYYVDEPRRAAAIAEAIREFQPHRTAMIWLSGTFIDRHTTAPLPAAAAGTTAAARSVLLAS